MKSVYKKRHITVPSDDNDNDDDNDNNNNINNYYNNVCYVRTHVGHFYCCTVHYGIYILFTHQQMHFLLNLKKFKFT